ncbi:hypothetical protein [Streptomyces sp. Caat 7-52]|uniref:hypothetical protein n=1 Tax=Streptomyces sp. Caat 7-52 TaxID=2949637 RepID=UPI0020361F80|nr:hypothetical protein [Streptomyces sp. Caat 7-52]
MTKINQVRRHIRRTAQAATTGILLLAGLSVSTGTAHAEEDLPIEAMAAAEWQPFKLLTFKA